MHVDTGGAQGVGGVAQQVEGFVVGQPQPVRSSVLQQPVERWPDAGAAAQCEQRLGFGARAEQALGLGKLAPQLCGLHDERRIRSGVQLEDGPEVPAASLGYVDPQRDSDVGGERGSGLLGPLVQGGHGTRLAPGVRQGSHGERSGGGADQGVGDRVAEPAHQRGRFGDPQRGRTWLRQAVAVGREGGGEGVQRPTLGRVEGARLPGVVAAWG